MTYNENNDSANNNRLSWPQIRNINQTTPQQQQHPSANLTTGLRGCAVRLIRDSHNEQSNSYKTKFKRESSHTPLERVLPKNEANVVERANQIVMYVTNIKPPNHS